MAQGDFLKGVEQAMRLHKLAKRTRHVYLDWMKKFIRFHHMKHPKEMGKAEVEAFLSDLVLTKNVSESTQNQAFSALMWLYTIYLESPLEGVTSARSRKRRKPPTVLSQDELRQFLSLLQGVYYTLVQRGKPRSTHAL